MTARRLAAIAGVVLVVAYPFAVYIGLSRWRPGDVALLLVGVAAARFALIAGTRPHGATLLRAARPLLPVAALAALAAALDDARFLLAMPVLASAAMLVGFGTTLRPGAVPAVERFARLQHPDLGPGEVHWCRGVTKVWCLFFVVNGLVSAVLATSAPLEWWTLYSGLLAYLLMGLLFAAEFALRKARFRRFGNTFYDRALARVFRAEAVE